MGKTMTIVLHYLDHSRARRIIWALEELGLKYETKVYFRLPNGLAPPELKQIHPSGKSPVITDKGKTYAESALIIDYLIAEYGKDSVLAPRGLDESLAIRYGEYASESNIMIAALYIGLNNKVASKLPLGLSAASRYIFSKLNGLWAIPELERDLQFLNDTIAKNDGYFYGGKLTAADIMYETTVYLIGFLGDYPDLNERFPEIAAWRKRLAERPAYERAVRIEKKLDHSRAQL